MNYITKKLTLKCEFFWSDYGASLQQQKVKALQAEIIALEVDTGTLSNSQLVEKQIATEAQIEEQEALLREVLMQIARLKLDLGL